MSELNNDVTPLSFWPRPERAEPAAEPAGEAAAGPAAEPAETAEVEDAEPAETEPAQTEPAAEAGDIDAQVEAIAFEYDEVAEDAEPAGAYGDSAAFDEESGAAAEDAGDPGTYDQPEATGIGARGIEDEDAAAFEDAEYDEVTEDEPAAELELDLATSPDRGPDRSADHRAGSSTSTGSTADRSGTYGHPEVDAVVERLDELDQLETADHVEVYEDAHRRLHQALLVAGNGQAGDGDG